MMTNVIIPVTTSDFSREHGPRVWHWDKVYFGPEPAKYNGDLSAKRYVVVTGDIIMHPDTGDWVVTSVDANHIPKLRPRTTNRQDNQTINDMIVIPSKTYNRRADVIHVDTSRRPYRFYVSSRIWINGSQASHFKVFMGTDISDKGNIISANYNSTGTLIGTNIELELVKFDRDETVNLAVKTPKSGYLRELPLHDDVVTLVFYTQDGSYFDSQTLVVSHTNFVPSHVATKYITDIVLHTPFISKSDKTVLEVPRNMLLQSMMLHASIHYNDGTVSPRYPVPSTKFQLLGADAFSASVDMHSVDTVLSYKLGQGEAAVGPTATKEKFITKPYLLKVVPSDAAYSVKLFVLPVWDVTARIWTLRYKLYDMKRKSTRDVTNLVEYGSQNRFNGQLYSQKQVVQVALNLANVSAVYQHYRPVQRFEITLNRPGDDMGVPSYYTLSYSSGTSIGYGWMCNLTTVGSTRNIDLSCGQATLDAWWENVYRNLVVLNTADLPTAPRPTHFRVIKHGTTQPVIKPIADIVSPFQYATPLGRRDTVIIELFTKTSDGDLELGSYSLHVV